MERWWPFMGEIVLIEIEIVTLLVPDHGSR